MKRDCRHGYPVRLGNGELVPCYVCSPKGKRAMLRRTEFMKARGWPDTTRRGPYRVKPREEQREACREKALNAERRSLS